MRALKDYQLLGVNWLLTKFKLGSGAILADEMGLGKTFQVSLGKLILTTPLLYNELKACIISHGFLFYYFHFQGDFGCRLDHEMHKTESQMSHFMPTVCVGNVERRN